MSMPGADEFAELLKTEIGVAARHQAGTGTPGGATGRSHHSFGQAPSLAKRFRWSPLGPVE